MGTSSMDIEVGWVGRTRYPLKYDSDYTPAFTLSNETVGKHELAFYTAYEADYSLRQNWNAVVKMAYDMCYGQSSEWEGSDPINCVQMLLAKLADDRCNNPFISYLFNFNKQELDRFLLVLLSEVKAIRRAEGESLQSQGGSFLQRFIAENDFILTRLDLSRHKTAERHPDLPSNLFVLPQLKSLELLNLSGNELTSLSADIGQLTSLKTLILSKNKLTVHTIPPTLKYCRQLNTLLLDNNNSQLHALPGWLLDMENLEKVYHRDGFDSSYGYEFRGIFHTDSWISMEGVRCDTYPFEELTKGLYKRIEQTTDADNSQKLEVLSLKFLAAKSVIASRCHYFDIDLPGNLSSYVSDSFTQLHMCYICQTTKMRHEEGYEFFKMEELYLKKYRAVPFMFWLCSKECLIALAVDVRLKLMKQGLEDEIRKTVMEETTTVRPLFRDQLRIINLNSGTDNSASNNSNFFSGFYRYVKGKLTSHRIHRA